MERIKQQLEEARKHRERLQQGHASSTDGVEHRKMSSLGSQNYRPFALKDKARWLLSGMALVIASVMITWLIGSDQKPTEWSYNLDLPESRQTSATGSPATKQLETRVVGLTERVDMLADSIARLESRLMQAQGITDSIVGAEQNIASATTPEVPAIGEAVQVLEALPPPASGQAVEEVSVAKTPRQTSTGGASRLRDAPVIAVTGTSPAAPLRTSIRATHEAPALTGPGSDSVASSLSITSKPLSTATSPEKEGQWVINLASSPSKTDADRLTEKARSRDIQTEQQQATVKGKQYWRVQITGFSTAEEARAYAGTAKAKLGITDVWITTR
ncbi:MAG TPA: SPOR domain-containing protein [Gammaproteobacteria bacterium]|nr:SPOR domain-containing protein [Gammaproteobacteria bacterium]